MIKKKDRLVWLIQNQDKWKYVPEYFPQTREGRKVLRKIAEEMMNQGLFQCESLAMLEVPVYTLVKKCRKMLPVK